jgi:carbon monoxide dehydrogenase subunit G
MAITVSVSLKKDFEVNCDAKKAFDLLVDVPKTTALYPKLDKLTRVEGETFRWEMAKIGAAGLSFQTAYSVKYSNDGAGKINWEPVTGNKNDNALISGGWVIKSAGDKKCSICFSTEAALDLPVPRLMKAVVEPVVKLEFEGQVNQFIENIQKSLTA